LLIEWIGIYQSHQHLLPAGLNNSKAQYPWPPSSSSPAKPSHSLLFREHERRPATPHSHTLKPSVRIASYNVHSCIGVDGRCAPERVAAVIAEMDPAVVCLQELDMERVRTGAIDQAAEIGKILGMQFHFNTTIEEPNGRYGDAILSRAPFKLKAAGCFAPVPRPVPREARGAIWIETIVNGQPWQIINTHLGLGHGERRLQARALVKDWIVPALAHPHVVLCGDFNSRPASTVHKILGEPLRDVFRLNGTRHPRTFPTRWPLLCLDYIYVGPNVQARHVECWKSPLAALASDHFPILAQIDVS
jgi:endonuclease/exonuclease/phosphatase family metal-dependent hydrolase